MRKIIIVWALPLMVAIFATLNVAVFAGDLEPTTPPGSTMKTLDQVEPRTPISALPYTITFSGSYYLVSDLNSSTDGIIVNADYVTIDLMGYSIIGSGSGSYSGVTMSGRRSVEIHNGVIRNFGGHGIYGGYPGRSQSIVNIRASGNGGFGIQLGGDDNLIIECAASDNGDTGLALYSGSILDSTSYNNLGDGIFAHSNSKIIKCSSDQNGGRGIFGPNGVIVKDSSSTDNTDFGIRAIGVISGNYVRGNDGGGISAGSESTIIKNVIKFNQGPGLVIDSNSMVSGNTVISNVQTGIIVENFCLITNNLVNGNNSSDIINEAGIKVNYKCSVKDNSLTHNKKNNILVLSSGNLIEENLVTGSGGGENGIKFDTTGNFYANNRASGNTVNYANTAGNTDGGGNVGF